jgi:fructuronate reductase
VTSSGGSGARRVLHLGLGNFHRAHQALYTADAASRDDPWEITGVAGTSPAVVEALRRQGMRYTVVTLGSHRSEVRQTGVITDAFLADRERARVAEEIAAPGTRIVSLTVTEKGYDMRAGSRKLDLDAPAVAHDLKAPPGAPPRSTVGRLAAGLLRRARAGAGPLTLLSCDNLTANGTTLRALLGDFAAALPSSEGEELLAFLDAAVECPDSMVDRIVPATTAEHRRLAARAGFADQVPVPAEPFSMWVLSDRFAAGRPAWEKAGAVLTGQVHAYESVKVRLLNGSHSLLAYLGLLTGRALIAEAAADERIGEAVLQLGEEYLPTLALPDGFDVSAYREQLAARFANHRLGHRTCQVGNDGSLKLAQRVPDAALWHLERGRLPVALALTVAAWLRCAAFPGQLAAERTGVPEDPHSGWLRALGARSCGGDPGERAKALARACLTDAAVLGRRLGERGEFVDAVGELLAALAAGGVPAALDHAGLRADARGG